MSRVMKLKPEIVDNILDSAELLFNEQGYRAISLDLVANRAGVSKRTLYKYFSDKNGLVCKVLLRRDAFFRESLTNVVAVFSDKIDKINAIISWYIRWFHSDNFHGCMFVRAQAEYQNKNEEICTIAREHKYWIQTTIQECLGKTQSCEEVSHFIMLALEGMISYTSLFGTENHNFAHDKKYIFDLINNIDAKNT